MYLIVCPKQVKNVLKASSHSADCRARCVTCERILFSNRMLTHEMSGWETQAVAGEGGVAVYTLKVEA